MDDFYQGSSHLFGGLDDAMELSPRDTASLEARDRPLQVRVELREGGAARAAGADAGGHGGRGAGRGCCAHTQGTWDTAV